MHESQARLPPERVKQLTPPPHPWVAIGYGAAYTKEDYRRELRTVRACPTCQEYWEHIQDGPHKGGHALSRAMVCDACADLLLDIPEP